MKRRWLFGAWLVLAAARRFAWAQPPVRKARIGFLSGSTPDPATLRSQVEPLRQGLRELGWIEGQNLAPIEFRWAEGKFDRLPALLDELLRLDLDILVTTSPRPAMLAKEAAPKTLAIVALGVDDPVQMGLAASIARPGGNITGISAAFAGLLETRLQWLKDILPTVWGGAGYLDAGGLASYRGDWAALYRRSAALIDKFLKGTKRGEIAFEQGTKLELVVSLKSARALGITIPRGVLVQADEVIE